MNPILLIDREEDPFLRLDLNSPARSDASNMFHQAAAFFERKYEYCIEFDPGYRLEDDECFEIRHFPIPEELVTFCSNPVSAPRVNAADFSNLRICGIVGYDFSNNQRRIYFQNSDSRRILTPGRRGAVFSLADTSTFRPLDHPVLLLDASITAIWDDEVLWFRSFHLVKRLLDLSSYFTEATNEQIGQFTSHSLIHCDDSEAFLEACNTWSRKKIALILQSEVLNNVTSDAIQNAASEVDYAVSIHEDRIVLPTEKRELRKLLQFLDEDLYRGPISQRRLLSSGKRELE